jgi:hypothetical protein
MLFLLAAAQSSQSSIDITARVIAIIGLVLSIAAMALTWYLWQRSGPRLSVTCFVKADAGSIRINIANKGRLAATIRAVELRDRSTIQAGGSTTFVTRWVISAQPSDAPLPRSIAPTEYIEADVDAKEAFEKAGGIQAVTVQAWVQRGDNRWLYSKPVKIR